MKKILAATQNKNKLIEFKRILQPLGYEVISQADVNLNIDVEETGKTFEENAYLKASALHKASKLAVVADDSGLEVDYLDKAPGVYSARFCGENTPYAEKNDIIIKKLENVPDEKRTARFVCVICFIDENGKVLQIKETCEGKIAYEQKGDNGFGYDPIFLYGDKTTAELDAKQKDEISHRGKALRKLLKQIKNKK